MSTTKPFPSSSGRSRCHWWRKCRQLLQVWRHGAVTVVHPRAAKRFPTAGGRPRLKDARASASTGLKAGEFRNPKSCGPKANAVPRIAGSPTPTESFRTGMATFCTWSQDNNRPQLLTQMSVQMTYQFNHSDPNERDKSVYHCLGSLVLR
jgi:hypothetical protein